MAKRSVALKRLEKALAGSRRSASNLRKKMKTQQPMEIAATVGGGFAAGWIDKENPAWLAGLGLPNPSLVIGSALAAYGLFSARSGQMEKLSTSIGTGMITAYAYTLAKQ